MMRIVNTPSTPTRGALLGFGLLALLAVAPPCFARVGVTSATDGDPLGKPPSDAERVLRIGIDVQANEVVSTSANDRAHLVFLDGSSLTVGPNARLTLDKFVYDPDKKTGELALTASQGVFRLVGGRISKTNAITVTTPASTIGVRGGIAIFEVTATQTTSTFAFGHSMTVTGLGLTQTVTRPGWQVTSALGHTPGVPVAAPAGSLTGKIGQLEGTRSGGSSSSSSGGGAAAGSSRAAIVTGTQALASQPATPVSAIAPPVINYQSVQSWNPSTNLPSGATNPSALPANNTSAVSMPQTFSLPPTGVATFNGTFVAGDSRGGSATGTIALGWNFGSRSGTLNAFGSTGGTATAPLNQLGNSVLFGGPLTVTANFTGATNGTGTVVGAFTSPNTVIGAFSGTTTNNASVFGGSFQGRR